MALGFYQLGHLLLIASVVEAAIGKKGRGRAAAVCCGFVGVGDAEAQGWMELGAAAQRISAASDCDGGSGRCAAPLWCLLLPLTSLSASCFVPSDIQGRAKSRFLRVFGSSLCHSIRQDI